MGEFRDTLTGIYNRAGFYKEAKKLLNTNTKAHYVLVYSNIENFKLINELYGDKQGDDVLIAFGALYSKLLADYGVVARVQSDHFVMCLPKAQFNIKAMVAECNALIKNFSLFINVVVAFGIYDIHDINVPVDQMCDRAYLAMRTIEGNYLKHYAYYDDEIRQRIHSEQKIASEMEAALAAEEFHMFLQPIFDIETKTITSAEALVRWIKSDGTVISPGDFIPLFEKNGFITKLDPYIWEQACSFLHNRISLDLPVVPISINISRINFYHTDLPKRLIAMVKKYELDPKYLKLEITESSYTENPSQLLNAIKPLQEFGFRVLMDDFGSGYSSLNMLMDVSVDILKIDQKFIKELEDSPRAGTVVGSIIRMAKWLNLTTIAEGVETSSQFEYLRSIGCDEIQGFYFSRPLPVSSFETFLNEQNIVNQEPDSPLSVISTSEYDMIWNANSKSNLFLNLTGGFSLYEVCDASPQELLLIRANQSYFDLTGTTNKSIGKDIMPSIPSPFNDILLNALEESEVNGRTESVNIKRNSGDGKSLYLEIHIKYLGRNNDRRVYLCSFIDLTSQQYAVKEAQRAADVRVLAEHDREREHYHFILQQMKTTVCEFSFATKHFFYGDDFSQYTLSSMMNGELLEDYMQTGTMSPTLRERILSSVFVDSQPEFSEFLDDIQNLHDYTVATVLMKMTDSSYRWCRITANRYADSNDNDAVTPDNILLSITDVDDTVRAEKELITSQHEIEKDAELYRLLIETSSAGVFEYSPEKDELHATLFGDNAKRSTFFIANYLEYLPQSSRISEEEKQPMIDAIHEASRKIVSGTNSYELMLNGMNHPKRYLMHYRSLADSFGKIVRIVGRFEEEKEKGIEVHATTPLKTEGIDSLTGLYNTEMMEYVASEKCKALLGEISCALFLLDVDDFTAINDTYGREAGDDILRRIGTLLRHTFRSNDLLGRIGGDAFAILISNNIDAGIVEDRAQLLCHQLAEMAPTPVHCSIGIAVSSTEGTSYDFLYKKASTALAEAKSRGKNCYIYCDESERLFIGTP